VQRHGVGAAFDGYIDEIDFANLVADGPVRKLELDLNAAGIGRPALAGL
jgi:hypothetical protein